MNKCNVCKKGVTKKSPALTCSRCDAVVHEKVECSGLNNKQRTALHAVENLEWVCKDCHLSSTRRTSFVSAEDEDEEDDIAGNESAVAPPVDLKKLFNNISKEVHKIVMRELDAVTKAAQHASDKIDEYEETAQVTRERIKNLERQQAALKSQNTHLETLVAALEQRLEAVEQAALDDYIEIAGVPYKENEDVAQLARRVGSLLQVLNEETKQIITVRRLPAREGKIGCIRIQMDNGDSKSRWLTAGRDAELLVSNLLPGLTGEAASGKIFLREALTGRNKHLLFLAKSNLKDTKKFKYVWCKYGKVFARKSDKGKIYLIRREKDVEDLAKSK